MSGGIKDSQLKNPWVLFPISTFDTGPVGQLGTWGNKRGGGAKFLKLNKGV